MHVNLLLIANKEKIMVQKTKKMLDGIPTYLKYITTIVSLVAALAGGIYAMEDRYVNQQDISKSLDMFNLKVQNDLDHIELQVLQSRYDNLTSEYYRMKQLNKAYPEDAELKDEMNYTYSERVKIKEKINNIIERVK